jgi:hypothetical protein
MSKPRRHRHKPSRQPPADFLLDKFSVQDIKKAGNFRDKILMFHWDFYSSLAYQRSKLADDLRDTLLEATERCFLFLKWQRSVKYKYALEPLLVRGSLVDPGGRFNIGDIEPIQFRPFPALYIAADKKTSFQELLSQDIGSGNKKDALDFALARQDSIATVSLSGSLDSVINLAHPKRLEKFVNLIKGFSVPEHLVKTAREIGLPPPELVRDATSLMAALLDNNWRGWPMQFDVPATSQIFGQLVAQVGIEGIAFPSKFTGKNCLAAFPQNFEGSDSFIELDDPSPADVSFRRLDSKSCRKIVQSSRMS